MSLTKHFALLSLVLLSLAGCTAYTKDDKIRVNPAAEEEPFTTVNLDVPDAKDLNASPYELVRFKTEKEQQLEYDLYAIEQDDRGVLFQRHQIDRVTQEIRTRAGGAGTIIVVFVHGWKHNATPCDDNLSCFRAVLQHLTEDEHADKRGKPRRVAGVYVGWRGLSACDGLAKQVSFFNRKNAAHRVGASQTREVLQNLRDLHEELTGKEEGNPVKSRLVIVGHSFGAALVHSAVMPDMLQDLYSAKRRLDNDNKQLPELQGYGDLVVLVNPAFESQLFEPLPREVKKLERAGYTFSNRRPVYVVVSSVGDVATHWAFPVGQSVSLGFQPLKLLRGPFYWHRHLVTAGNDLRTRTHLATRIGGGEHQSGDKAAREQSNCFQGALSSKYAECACSQSIDYKKEFAAAALAATRTTTAAAGQRLLYGNVELTPYERWKTSPYWIIKAEKNVVRDHGDVFNPTFVSLLRDMVAQDDPRLDRARNTQRSAP